MFFNKQVIETEIDRIVPFMDALPASVDKLSEILQNEKLKEQAYGPVIVRCTDQSPPIAFIFWKGIKNCNLLIGKEEQKYIHRSIALSK